MTIKNKIASLLEKNTDNIISGQQLADTLSVSRAAIWKAIESLRKDGYIINAATNKGYQLAKNSDIISSQGIQVFLSKQYKNIPIEIYPTLNSTNTQAKKLAADYAKHGTVIIANHQSCGRGRFDRSFFSPADTGIYMSIIFKPVKATINDISLTTIYSAVAVCRAIEKLTNNKPKIKWVNDIFVNDKKVCGILTETVSDFETKTVENIVVGIGINVKTADNKFPKELKNIAGSLSAKNISRNQIIAEVLNNIFELNKNYSDEKLIAEYKSYSFILGNQITYLQDDKIHTAKAIDINNKGNLVIKLPNGKTHILESGEVSILSKTLASKEKRS